MKSEFLAIRSSLHRKPVTQKCRVMTESSEARSALEWFTCLFNERLHRMGWQDSPSPRKPVNIGVGLKDRRAFVGHAMPISFFFAADAIADAR